MQATVELLRPIHDAKLLAIHGSHVIAMDETPIKAGVDKGNMKTGYFWPVYSERLVLSMVRVRCQSACALSKSHTA